MAIVTEDLEIRQGVFRLQWREGDSSTLIISGWVVYPSAQYFLSKDFREKHGVVNRRDLFHWFKTHKDSLLNNDFAANYEITFYELFQRDLREVAEGSRYVAREFNGEDSGDELVGRIAFTREARRRRFILLDSTRENEERIVYRPSAIRAEGVIVAPVAEEQVQEEERESSNWNRKLSYSFKMDERQFDFFRSLTKTEAGNWYGMEIELATVLSPLELQKIVTDVEPKQKPFFIMKADSSIQGNPYKYTNLVELVTVPCTAKYLRVAWKTFFEKIEKLLKEKGLDWKDVFDMRNDLSNGIHIHVSKDSFRGYTHAKKFMAIFNDSSSKTVNLFQLFAKRPNTYIMNSYCKIPDAYKGRTLVTKLRHSRYKYTKKRLPSDKIVIPSSERYSVCHDGSPHTLEVRLFQSLVDLDHILKCLSLVDSLVKFTDQMSIKDMGLSFPTAFKEWLNKQHGFAKIKEEINACV